MSNAFQTVLQKALFCLDGEKAHTVSIRALESGLVPSPPVFQSLRLRQDVAGLVFENPVGLAAGYDKNAQVPDAILRLGFGHSEVGTLTPRAQTGNPKPRLFRLPHDNGVINRLGFNNEGHGVALARLEGRLSNNKSAKGIVGINVGANKDSEDFIQDYEIGIETFAHLADYFTINISSPNTPGLRNLQAGEILKQLVDRVFDRLNKSKRQPPVFLKVAPDLEPNEIADIAKVVSASPLAALIVSNTTLSRDGLSGQSQTVAAEAGGLSGKPLYRRSTVMLARFREALPKSIALVGVGGIGTGQNAYDKIEAGADLVQLYSRMIYEGPGIARSICRDLDQRLGLENINQISEIVGRRSAHWASQDLQE